MGEVINLPTEQIAILCCPICESEDWWLTSTGEVICAQCQSDVLYRWWDSEVTGGAA